MSRKTVALDNLMQSFRSEMSEEGAKRLLRKVYIHFGQMLLEVPQAMRLNPENAHRYVTFESEERLLDALKKGQGVLALKGTSATGRLSPLPCHALLEMSPWWPDAWILHPWKGW